MPLIPESIPSEASGTSGEFSGLSGTPGPSGDLEPSGDIELSGTSGTSGVSIESGDTEVPEIILVPDTDKGQYFERKYFDNHPTQIAGFPFMSHT